MIALILSLQWGRDHLIAEIGHRAEAGAVHGRLQWGRDHLIAEMEQKRLDEMFTVKASMGPRSSDRGNRPLEIDDDPVRALQWGRDHLIAEMHTISSCTCITTGLQWGRDHLIAEMELKRDMEAIIFRLQWGRDHLIAEMWTRTRGIALESALQWGRDHLIAEMNRAVNLPTEYEQSFNGAAII